MTIEQTPTFESRGRNFNSDVKYLEELKAQIPPELKHEKIITALGIIVHEHLAKSMVPVQIDETTHH